MLDFIFYVYVHICVGVYVHVLYIVFMVNVLYSMFTFYVSCFVSWSESQELLL